MKKNKWVSMLVVLVMVFALVFTTTVTASAATMKLNKKSASVYVGSTVTLKVLNTSSKVTVLPAKGWSFAHTPTKASFLKR